MSKKRKLELPPCGLYRTGRALESEPEDVPAGILVMFHNHSNRGIPMLQLPYENEHNNWSFHKYGPGIEEDDDFIEAMAPLREQGIYFLGEDLETPDGTLPKFTLVQLGYNLNADPILFLAERQAEANALTFPETGYRFEDLDILGLLRPSYPLLLLGDDEEEEDDKHFSTPPSSDEILN